MTGPTSTTLPWGRLLPAAAVTLVALMVWTGGALAATKDYSLTIAPNAVLAGELVDVTATFTNRASQQQLGSANLTPPQGYTAASVTSLSRPAPAMATIVGGVVQLRGLALPPGAAVTVGLKVSTPCTSSTASVWDNVIAKQANDFSGLPGNDLTLDPALSSLTTTTTGTCSPCPENTSCTANLGGPTGSASSVIADPSSSQPDSGQLTLAASVSLDCAGYNERSTDAFVTDAPQNRPKRGVLTFSGATRPVTTKDPLEVCYASPMQFAQKPKTLLTTAIIDGELNYVGRLQDCKGKTSPPCVISRDNATRTIVFSMPTGDPRFS